MNSIDLWQEGQYDALAKISPELRAKLAEWAPNRGNSPRREGSSRSHAELAQLAVAYDACYPRLA